MKTLPPTKSTLRTCIASSLLLLSLVGCDDDDNTTGEGYVKLYNLSADSPSIYMTVDEDLSTDSDDDDEHYEGTFSGLDYGDAHSNILLDSLSYEYQLAWQDDDSSDVDDLTVIYEDALTITDDTIHLVVLSNSVLTPDVVVYDIPVIDDDDDTDDDLFNLRVLNMHSNQEAVDFYISEEDETFNEAVLVGSYSYQELSDNQKVDQDDYIFYITTAGSDEVLFTSSSIPFYYSSQNIMIIKDNNGAGASSYSLDKMSDSAVIEYTDAEAEAQFSAYNALAIQDDLADYQGELALHLGGISDTPKIASIAFGELSEPLVLASGDYSIDLTTATDNTPLLSNHLFSVSENTNKTVFVYSELEYVDEDGDGDIDEDNDGVIDEIEVGVYTLIIENSLLTSIYQHEVEIVNLIQSDDFSQVQVYFVRSDETIDSSAYSSEVNYKTSSGITLKNNTYQVFVVAKDNGSEIVLDNFELILDEESTEQFLILEASDEAATGYKSTLLTQAPVSE